MPDKYPTLKNMCAKCRKKNTCKGLCAFAERYVNQDGAVFEMENGNDSITVLSESFRITNCTSLHKATLDGDGEDGDETLFSDQNESAFSSFQATNKGTKIFLHRFFKGWQFKDIATKFDITENNAKSTYYNALQRFQDGLDILDERTKLNKYAFYALKNSDTIKQLTNNQKFYLLYVLFGITADEIADLTDFEKKKVQKGVNYIASKLKHGDYEFEDLAIPGQWEKTAKANSMAGLKHNRKTA